MPSQLTERITAALLFPGLLTLAAGGAGMGIALGTDRNLMLALSTTALFFVLLGLERIFPHRKKWLRSDGQVPNDIVHALFGTVLGGKLGNAATTAIFAGAAGFVVDRLGFSPWPSTWPFVLQVVVVFVIADFGRYWQHRLMHRFDLLWRFHELHHSGCRLTAFKATRSHIVERVFQQVFLFGLLITLCAPAEVIFAYVLINSCIGSLSHANVEMRLGPLNYVLMGPEPHRLHHSTAHSEATTNYGSALVVWDILFGTFSDPARISPVSVGIADDPTPSGIVPQLLRPFWPPDRASLAAGTAVYSAHAHVRPDPRPGMPVELHP